MTDPEIEITAGLVHALVKEQHPELAGPAVREVPGGWGNQMWRGDDPTRPRVGRSEKPLSHPHGPERGTGPSRRQAGMGTRVLTSSVRRPSPAWWRPSMSRWLQRMPRRSRSQPALVSAYSTTPCSKP